MASGFIQIREDARSETGRIAPGLQVRVTNPSGTPAQIYSDPDGLVPLAGGVATADADGLVNFYVRKGSYVSVAEVGGRVGLPKPLQAGDGLVAEMPEGLRLGLEHDNTARVKAKHDQIRDAGGGLMQFPHGKIVAAIQDWHPSVSFKGADKGGTELIAPANITPDQNGVGAVIRVLARARGTLATSAWYPVFQDVTIDVRKAMQIPGAEIDGILYESASVNDPDYGTWGGKAYGAGALFRVEVVNAARYGIRDESDRQRLYLEGCRVLYSGDDGLSILANDPVIGPRCGFGNNAGHQVAASAISGFMGIGMNIWGNPDTRGPDCLAMHLQNCNGITLWGTNVLNDTLSIRGTTSAHKAVIVGGIDFRPMEELFTADGVVKGDQDEYLNAFIRVRGYKQLIIGKCGYSRAGPPGNRFKHVLTAADAAACHLDLVAHTDPAVKPWASSAAVPILVEAGSVVRYDYLDLATGVRRSNITHLQD